MINISDDSSMFYCTMEHVSKENSLACLDFTNTRHLW